MGSNLKRSDYPVFYFLNFTSRLHLTVPSPKNLIVYLCYFLSLCWVPVNLRMESRMRRHSHPQMKPGCQMSTLAKMSSLWQNHIHNKAFIFFIIFFLYRYLYTFSFYFHTCSPPPMTVRYKKKKAQLHLRSGNPWQHAASSRKTWPPNVEGGPSHMNGSSTHLRRCQWKPVCLATSNTFHIKFFVDLLSFRLASGYNTMLHKGERER